MKVTLLRTAVSCHTLTHPMDMNEKDKVALAWGADVKFTKFLKHLERLLMLETIMLEITSRHFGNFNRTLVFYCRIYGNVTVKNLNLICCS